MGHANLRTIMRYVHPDQPAKTGYGAVRGGDATAKDAEG